MPIQASRTFARAVLVAVLGLSALGASHAATTLKLAHFAAESHPAHTAAMQLRWWSRCSACFLLPC